MDLNIWAIHANGTWSFVTVFFHLAECFQGLSMLEHVPVLYFFIIKSYFIICMYHNYISIYLLIDGQLDYFHIGAIVNNAATQL